MHLDELKIPLTMAWIGYDVENVDDCVAEASFFFAAAKKFHDYHWPEKIFHEWWNAMAVVVDMQLLQICTANLEMHCVPLAGEFVFPAMSYGPAKDHHTIFCFPCEKVLLVGIRLVAKLQ